MEPGKVQRATLFDPQSRIRLAQGATPSIRAMDLQHHFGEGELRKQILFDNNLTVYPGEIIIMTGPSGSGKTTLLTLIGALRTVQAGSLEVLGRALQGASASALQDFRRDIGFIFQAHNLFESLTAQQNVRMSLELHQKDGNNRDWNAKAKDMLEKVGLGNRIHHKPKQLSGGQKQRVAIARGLVHQPKLVLADEPTAALDEQSGRMVVELLQRLAMEQQTTILMVTHDNRILDVADRIVTLVDGRIRSDALMKEAAILTQMLAKCGVFERVTPRTLTRIADEMTIELVPAGTRIIREMDPGDRFFLIRQGSVTVRRGTPEVNVATLHAGDHFGEAALLTGRPRNASVYANEDSYICSLSKASFQSAMAESASHDNEIRNAYAGAFDR
ncbi:Macrolide export ATP-binding/permease protein MacB [Pirellula sp. SH-Sr6A]|uniref:ATP-binding cassette domain-containing protein n=1 Tax=Pirellula sp. SH-Sr6A TaxID=1632865 RepID=UPI00078D5572|nr:ATP-binding cassette domain-containing protein [Pirellula sp. SH-Sr6A]AMV32509.1 Macrolide export ATP-binding/permease protein MacB [Pirellula sp. SH-Sr6A]